MYAEQIQPKNSKFKSVSQLSLNKIKIKLNEVLSKGL